MFKSYVITFWLQSFQKHFWNCSHVTGRSRDVLSAVIKLSLFCRYESTVLSLQAP